MPEISDWLLLLRSLPDPPPIILEIWRLSVMYSLTGSLRDENARNGVQEAIGHALQEATARLAAEPTPVPWREGSGAEQAG